MNGLILRFERRNGHERKKKSYFICIKYSLHSGAQLHLWSVARPLSAFKSTMSYYCLLLSSKMANQVEILLNSNQAKSILILRLSHLDQIRSIWMKMKKKCCKNAELVLQTLKVKKPLVKCVRKNLRKLGGLLSSRNSVNWSKRVSIFTSQSKSKELTITKKFLLKREFLKVDIM